MVKSVQEQGKQLETIRFHLSHYHRQLNIANSSTIKKTKPCAYVS